MDFRLWDGDLRRRKVDRSWTADVLLRQRGLFYLKDVVPVLGLNQGSLIWQKNHLLSIGKKPIEVMGLNKMLSRWYVWMPLFEIYLRESRGFEIKVVDLTWSVDELLGQQGVFRLNDVAMILPLTASTIQKRARANADARAQFGAWKDLKEQTYLLDMEPFSEWARETWPKEFSQ